MDDDQMSICCGMNVQFQHVHALLNCLSKSQERVFRELGRSAAVCKANDRMFAHSFDGSLYYSLTVDSNNPAFCRAWRIVSHSASETGSKGGRRVVLSKIPSIFKASLVRAR